MNNPNTEPRTPDQPVPQNPDEQTFQPSNPTEINPGAPGTNTEVDLDTQKISTFPDKDAPKEH